MEFFIQPYNVKFSRFSNEMELLNNRELLLVNVSLLPRCSLLLLRLLAVAKTVPPAAIDGAATAAAMMCDPVLLGGSSSLSSLPIVEASESPAPLSDFASECFSLSSSSLSLSSSFSSIELILGVPASLRTSTDALLEIVLAEVGLLEPADGGLLDRVEVAESGLSNKEEVLVS